MRSFALLVSKWPVTENAVKFWESEVVVVIRIWGTFDLLVFKVIWGSFNALVSKWPVTRKWLAVDRKGVEIWDPVVIVTYIWGTFDLLVFRVISGSFDALVSDVL